jgi:hypothetical protein
LVGVIQASQPTTPFQLEQCLNPFTLEFSPQLFLGRQVQLVSRREDLLCPLPERVPHHRFVFVRAQDQAHGWVLAFAHFFGLEVTGVQQHLPDVLLRSLAGFQVDQHEAVQHGAKGAGSF